MGELHYVFQAAGEQAVRGRGSTRISPKIEQTLLELAGGDSIVVSQRKKCPRPKGVTGVLFQDAPGKTRWLSHSLIINDPPLARWSRKRTEALTSWATGIRYVAEGTTNPFSPSGFRPPQLGALHALGAYWSLHKSPATVVMPTGTGKTETLLAALIAEVRGTLLVVVPNTALRDQTVRKFKTLGLLREIGGVDPVVKNPVVGVLTRRPRTAADLDIFTRANVVVATMDAIGYGSAAPLAPKVASLVDMLAVDEAHHIPAEGWQAFRDAFTQEQRVVQFTATPFRRDQKLVEGEVVYSYPLRRAQEDGFFKAIRFDPVFEVDPADGDSKIAEKALAQLNADLADGLDHIMMARCKSISRAQALHSLYEKLASKHSPILVHSRQAGSSQELAKLFARDSRIVVCVDMLGEGFDLPQLKVAAVHDMHQSLPVLLQFTGRFVRSAGDRVGDATIIGNIADNNVSDALDRLYQEDADWNRLLSEMSSKAAKEHKALVDFLNESEAIHEETDVPLQALSSSLLTRFIHKRPVRWQAAVS